MATNHPTPSAEALRLIACLGEWRSYLTVALEQIQIDAVNRLVQMDRPDAALAVRASVEAGILDQHIDNQSLHAQMYLAIVLSHLTSAVEFDLKADTGER